MRQGDVVHFLHTDHLGSTTLVTDQAGAEVGRAQYDPYGNVISNTLPAALAETLAGHLDPATGLQYHGDRYYDAWPGGYTQPNSSGGLPGMPQSLNRYSVASGSVSSALLAPSNDALPGDLLFGVLSVSANKTAGYYAKQVSAQGVTSLLRPRFAGYGVDSQWGTLSFQGSRGRFKKEGLLGFFDVSDPIKEYGRRSQFNSRGLVRQLGENVYETVTGTRFDLDQLGNSRWLRNVTFTPEVMPYSRLRYPLGFKLNPAARSVLGEAIPFGVDAAWQLAADWNTDMPVGYRIGRATVAAGVGFAGTGISYGLVAGAWYLAAGTGPPGWAALGVSIIIGITLEAYYAEKINNAVFPVQKR